MPPDMLTRDTLRSHASALHRVDSERNSHPQRVQGNPGKVVSGGIMNSLEQISRAESNQSFQPRGNGTLPDIQSPQQAARCSFISRQPASINFSRLFFRQQDGFWYKSPPPSPSHQASMETNTHQSFGVPVFEGSVHITSTCNFLYAEPSFIDNDNQPAQSIRSSVSGDTIILPDPSTAIELQVPRRAATRTRTSEINVPLPRMSQEAFSINTTAPLEEQRPRRSPRNCK